MTNKSIVGAKICIVGATLFSFILVVLHFVRSDLDPSWRFISEYELGPFGWMMQVAFFSLGMSCVSLCIAIFPYARSVVGWLGMLLLMVSSSGMILAAIFVPDKENKLHEVGAMLDSVPFAALLLNFRLYRHPEWSSAKKILIGTAGLPLLGLIVFVGSLAMMLPTNGGQPGPSVLAGWPNRFFILMHIAWLVPIAWFAISVSQRRLLADSKSKGPNSLSES